MINSLNLIYRKTLFFNYTVVVTIMSSVYAELLSYDLRMKNLYKTNKNIVFMLYFLF